MVGCLIGLLLVYPSPMTTVAHFVFEHPVALVAFVRTLSVRIVVILVFSCSSGFLSSWSFDTVHELLVQQEAGHRGVGAVAQVANVSVVSFFVDAIDVRLLRDKKKRQNYKIAKKSSVDKLKVENTEQ